MGLDPINKKLHKIFRISGQIFCFQEILTAFQIVSYKKFLAIFFRNLSSQLHQKILPEFFLVFLEKKVGSKFPGFPEKCFFCPENFSDLRIYVYRISSIQKNVIISFGIFEGRDEKCGLPSTEKNAVINVDGWGPPDCTFLGRRRPLYFSTGQSRWHFSRSKWHFSWSNVW